MKINFHACCGQPIAKEHEARCPEKPELTPGYREINSFRESPRFNRFFAGFGKSQKVDDEPARKPVEIKIVGGNLRNVISLARRVLDLKRLKSRVTDESKLGNLYRVELSSGDVVFALLREMPRGSETHVVENFENVE